MVAGSKGVWTFRFVCGGRPIAPGGSVAFFCEVPKFWLGINLQTEDPTGDDYAWAAASEGAAFELRDIPGFYKRLLWGRVVLPAGLEPGQEVRFGVGTEQAPAYAIAHAYREAPVSVQVDYAGDGQAYTLWPPLVVSVVPGPLAKLSAVLPSRVRPGERFRLRVRAEDANSNPGACLEADLRIALEGPAGTFRELTPAPNRDGIWIVEDLSVTEPGIYRARVAAQGLHALSNPTECVVEETPVRVYWGDLHCHTGYSDGAGTFRDNLEFARDRAFLDAFGFAEHVCAGRNCTTGPVDKGGSDWALLGPEMAAILNQANAPGRLATVLGYEYTPTGRERGPSGDHCVFSPGSRWTDLPVFLEQEDLMALAREAGCLVIPHVGGRTPRWESYSGTLSLPGRGWGEGGALSEQSGRAPHTFPYPKGLPGGERDSSAHDPRVTPLAEIASMHEHSEYFVQDALRRGFKVGVVGMSDGHFGMPGYDCWALHGRTRGLKRRNFSVQSAITAFCTKELTREAVFQAMRDRRVYATTGQRTLLEFSVDGRPMGAELATGERPVVRVGVHGTAPIARVDLIRGDRRVAMWLPTALDWAVEWEDVAPLAGETYYYVRVTQSDFALAWSSPVWVRYEGPDGAADDVVAALPLWNGGPEWPEADPATCDPARTDALRRLLRRRGIAERFQDLTLVGVFAENRGRFALFRGTDGADGSPIHLHHYVDFEDGRLYIARGHSDYGQYPNTTAWRG